MKPLICPNAKTCDLYKLYTKKMNHKAIDIIADREGIYGCRALEYVQENNKPGDYRIIKDLFYTKQSCAFIELLNNQKVSA